MPSVLWREGGNKGDGRWRSPIVLSKVGNKARGHGGKFGRWRTLKGGRRVFVTGGTPTTKFFNAKWEETPAKQSTYAVTIWHGKDGKFMGRRIGIRQGANV